MALWSVDWDFNEGVSPSRRNMRVWPLAEGVSSRR